MQPDTESTAKLPGADLRRPATLVRRPSFGACMAAITAPQLYRNFAIHLFVMFPAAMVMCWIATNLDVAVGFDPVLAWPDRLFLGLGMIGIGGFWVWYVYGYLFLAGGGSPGTHVDGGPVAMVDNGPYTMIRHPSVLGKMLGVIGLAVAWGSLSFHVFFVPVLIIYSVVTNRIIQERFCHERFGARYQTYCARVPMLIPRPSGIKRWMNSEAALGEADEAVPAPVEHQPTGIWSEFRWYLMGLVGLISLFGGIWWFAAM